MRKEKKSIIASEDRIIENNRLSFFPLSFWSQDSYWEEQRECLPCFLDIHELALLLHILFSYLCSFFFFASDQPGEGTLPD
jgi:hypothetical protein